MMLQTALFYLISFALVLFAIGVVASRSAVYSVLSLVAALCMMAGLMVLLKAFLVATILVLVYAGAILVLFLFVVMLLDLKTPPAVQRRAAPIGVAVGVAALIVAQALRVVRGIPVPPPADVHGTAQAVGALLFNRYVLPFELTSFLILAGVVSVVVLAKKERI